MIDFSEHSGLFRFVSKQFCLFRLFQYRFKTPKQTENFFFGFTKQTETNAKQILFRFVSVRTEIFYFSFRGHPSHDTNNRATTRRRGLIFKFYMYSFTYDSQEGPECKKMTTTQ